jgi:hypothetical protein
MQKKEEERSSTDTKTFNSDENNDGNAGWKRKARPGYGSRCWVERSGCARAQEVGRVVRGRREKEKRWASSGDSAGRISIPFFLSKLKLYTKSNEF